jgi:HlyD family secretion protein
VGDKAKIRVIKTGIQDDTNIEVKTGLKRWRNVITGYILPFLKIKFEDMIWYILRKRKKSYFILVVLSLE